MIVTREGVFLQHIHIERIHIAQREQNILGTFPLAAYSSKMWPTRTAKNIKKNLSVNMAPDEAVQVILESRRNDPAIASLQVLSVNQRTVAAHDAFTTMFDFNLNIYEDDSYPRYRTLYCGFMDGEWFYGISYTAARRYYFDRDLPTFEEFLDAVKFTK